MHNFNESNEHPVKFSLSDFFRENNYVTENYILHSFMYSVHRSGK